MSNGPYGQIVCRCGAVSLLVCGSPLGHGADAEDETVSFWPLDFIQVAQGADDLDVSADERGIDAWRCRRCEERLLYADEASDTAVLVGQQEDAADPEITLAPARQRRLEALGYRVVSEK